MSILLVVQMWKGEIFPIFNQKFLCIVGGVLFKINKNEYRDNHQNNSGYIY